MELSQQALFKAMIELFISRLLLSYLLRAEGVLFKPRSRYNSCKSRHQAQVRKSGLASS